MTVSESGFSSFAARLAAVQSSPIRELLKLLGRPEVISFAGGFPDAALFDVEGLRQAADAALATAPAAALQYGATEGHGPLRESLSDLMAGRGAAVAPEELVVTTGSQQAIDLLGKVLVDPGDVLLVESPTFLAAILAFRLYEANLVGVAADAHGVDVDDLERRIVAHRPKAIYLIPTFGNPSGALTTLERRRRVLELAVRYRTLVIEDDPYGELYFGAEAPPPSLLALTRERPEARAWVVHLGSLSKIVSPGLRVGWMAAPPEVLAKATMVKGFADAHTSTFAQATADRYLRSGRLAASLARVRATYRARAEAMSDALETRLPRGFVSFARPQGGMFCWARLADGRDSSEYARRALEHDVAFVPGAPFYCGDVDRATFRLSFVTVDEARIREGVDRLSLAAA